MTHLNLILPAVNLKDTRFSSVSDAAWQTDAFWHWKKKPHVSSLKSSSHWVFGTSWSAFQNHHTPEVTSECSLRRTRHGILDIGIGKGKVSPASPYCSGLLMEQNLVPKKKKSNNRLFILKRSVKTPLSHSPSGVKGLNPLDRHGPVKTIQNKLWAMTTANQHSS